MVRQFSLFLLVFFVCFSVVGQEEMTEDQIVDELIANSIQLEEIISEQKKELTSLRKTIESLQTMVTDLQNGLMWQENQLGNLNFGMTMQQGLVQEIQVSFENYVQDVENAARKKKVRYGFGIVGTALGGLLIGSVVGVVYAKVVLP